MIIVPGPPSSLRIGNKTETELEIEWNKPMVPNGRIINYIVSVNNNNNNKQQQLFLIRDSLIIFFLNMLL